MVGVREFKLEIVKHQLMVQAPYIRVFIYLADWFLTPHSKMYHLYTCTTIVRMPLSHLLSTVLQIFVEVKMIFAIFFHTIAFLNQPFRLSKQSTQSRNHSRCTPSRMVETRPVVRDDDRTNTFCQLPIEAVLKLRWGSALNNRHKQISGKRYPVKGTDPFFFQLSWERTSYKLWFITWRENM